MAKSGVQQSFIETPLDENAISSAFAGLEGMLIKFTNETWARIPAPHRRHISYDDILQEARMRAWMAMRSYDSSKKVKLSSWVYGTLALRMREVNAPFTDPTRNSGRYGLVVSMDPESSDQDLRDSRTVSGEQTLDVLTAFDEAYESGDDETRQMFLDVLGFRARISVGAPDVRARSLNVLTRCKLSEKDIRTLQHSESERCILVAAKHSNTKQAALPQIECVVCANSYSVALVGKSIDAKTLVCSTCYEQQAQSTTTCFAKEYTPGAFECTSVCPDRSVCASRMGAKMSAKIVPDDDDPFESDSMHTLTIGSEQLEIVPDDAPDGHDLEDDDDESASEAHVQSADSDSEDDSFVLKSVNSTTELSSAPKPSRQKAQISPVPAQKQIKISTQAETPASKPKPAAKLVLVSKTSAVKPVKDAPKPAVKATPAKSTPKPAKTPVKAVKAVSDKPKATRVRTKEPKPQYWSGLTPFRPDTNMQKIVERLQVPEGLKMSALEKFVERAGLNFRGVKHNLAKGKNFNGQFEWKFTVTGTGTAAVATLKITKHPTAEYRKACLLEAHVNPVPAKRAAKKVSGK
jgi:hypothetical protein